MRVLDGDDVCAITATEAARTNASERRMKVFTVNPEPTATPNQLNSEPTVVTLAMVCFVRISSAGENGFVGLWFRAALVWAQESRNGP